VTCKRNRQMIRVEYKMLLMRPHGTVLPPQLIHQSLQAGRKLSAIRMRILAQPFTYRMANRFGGFVVEF
jgi:hypothetical protein